MIKNPFYYSGPLDPVKNKSVLVPRENELNRVIEGINDGDYWAILGPREIGKTTFLRQIEHQLNNDIHIYFNLQISPETDEDFYQWLIDKLIREIPSESKLYPDGIKRTFNPQMRFLHFLENFKPGNREDKKIILQFDEIEGIPSVKNFCDLWRTIYHERYHQKQLNKYSVVITGSDVLVAVTTKPHSPFNIAKNLYLKDFSAAESGRLIDLPFRMLNIEIEPKAKKKLIAHLSGHPKMLQEACYNLVETAFNENRAILENDIDAAIYHLLIENTTIDTLAQVVKEDKKLENLVKDIIRGRKRKYHPYKEYSLKGPGPIVEGKDSFCTVRNEVFKTFFKDTLNIADDESRFQNRQIIGTGGMGVVYKAKDNVLDRIVAIKQISSSVTHKKGNLERFIKEASTTAKLRHKNIVRVYDIQKVQDDYLIIMEFIEGMDYKKIVNIAHPLPLEEILWIAKSLFSALDYFHSNKIIHRDIKPKNIMKDHKENEIKIVDFGLAAISDQKRESSFVIGTPEYLSPEQIADRKNVDHRADIYSAGVTLFHITAGQVPFSGKDKKEIFKKHLQARVPLVRSFRKDIPYELADLIERCMAKKPEKRFQSAEEVLKELENIEAKVKKGDTDQTQKTVYETPASDDDH